MKNIFRVLHIAICIAVTGYFAYSAYVGKAFWESADVQRNTEFTGKRVYTGYGNRLNHK